MRGSAGRARGRPGRDNSYNLRALPIRPARAAVPPAEPGQANAPAGGVMSPVRLRRSRARHPWHWLVEASDFGYRVHYSLAVRIGS